jgi:hypothetical protein
LCKPHHAALRGKDITDADIGAALASPALTKQLIDRHYGAGSANPADMAAAGFGSGDSPGDDAPWLSFMPSAPPGCGCTGAGDARPAEIPMRWHGAGAPPTRHALGSSVSNPEPVADPAAVQHARIDIAPDGPDLNPHRGGQAGTIRSSNAG